MTVAPPDPVRKEAPAIPSEVMAEAAVWVARLHGPSRSRRMELACLKWQSTSSAHARAFEICTDGWEMVGGIRVRDVYAAASARLKDQQQEDHAARVRRSWLAAIAIAVLVGAGVLLQVSQRGVYVTDIGELRSVVLEDGSRVSLNTATRVRVDLKGDRRQVRIESGEALFEVAKDPNRPFVVHALGSDVVALGTSFVVRVSGARLPDGVAVTLLSGRVAVQPSADNPAPFKTVRMAPGDRLRIASASGASKPGTPRVDRPAVDQLTAWKRSEVVFEGATLGEAVGEMNRYNRASIVLWGGPAVEGRKVSGIFRTTDIAGFAQAAAELHGLALKQREGGWDLGPGP